MALKVLSGGAAQGLIVALAGRFRAETGADIAGTFTSVGAIRDKVLAGEAADLVILSRSAIEGLSTSGHLSAPVADIGTVPTSVAVREGDPRPAIATPDELRAALLAADAIFTPETRLATAGIHFAAILDKLGIRDAVAGRHLTFPNGNAAMRAMAGQPGGSVIGCTQATEILHTPGLTLVGALPSPFELVTLYTAAVSARAEAPELARVFMRMLTGPGAAAERGEAGFEPARG